VPQKTAADLLAEDMARSARSRAIAGDVRSSPGCSLKDGRLGDIYGVSASGTSVTTDTAATIPTYFACARLISDMIGSLPLKLYQKTANGREEMTDHPAHRLVSSNPSELSTAFHLRKLTHDGVSFGGNGYIRVWRDQFFQPAELQRLAPSDVRPEAYKTQDGRTRLRYVVDGKQLTKTDIIHVFGYSSNGYSGVSPVRILRDCLGIQLAQRNFAAGVMRNGARFPGLLTAGPGLTKEQLIAARDEWDKRMTDWSAAGRPPILPNGWSYAATQGMTLEDAEFLESRKFERSEIATVFGVPEVLLGNSDKASSWGTGIETLTNGFLAFSLNPWLVNWEQSLGCTLLTEEEQASGYYFRFTRGALLQVALEAQAKFFREMRDIGAFSINDVRRRLEENDLPDNIGDDYHAPFNGSGGTPAKQEQNQGSTA
jgi:HK97 family phage portal protein